jgi:hypothetical protein
MILRRIGVSPFHIVKSASACIVYVLDFKHIPGRPLNCYFPSASDAQGVAESGSPLRNRSGLNSGFR